MEISNISMGPDQPYLLGQLDATIFPDGIPVATVLPLEPKVLPAPSEPLPEDSAQNLDIYA
jgi:hypothetical protein